MKQSSLNPEGFEKYRKKTRRERFLEEMDAMIPWSALVCQIEPYYAKPKGAGRPPRGLEMMLRIHCLQHWFNLSDPGAEEALYDSRALRAFARIDLTEAPVPDESTICRFRHLLEQYGLSDELFDAMNRHLKDQGIALSEGTIVDATLIHASPSTKNQQRSRDPEMKSTKKGGQYYFGMKAHIGMDKDTQQIHSLDFTAANVHDSQALDALLHGEEKLVYGDSAYQGQTGLIESIAPQALDFTHQKSQRNRPLTTDQKIKNRYKSKTRAKVEHAFGVLKHVFGYRKARYKGLYKNAQHLTFSFALVNVYMQRKRLMTVGINPS